jgi:signal recognition particle subunit SEC65
MKEFFEALNRKADIKRNDIIEKDFQLHRLLYEISNDDGYLRDNLVFKGGTCLIKTYLDYYRFSEDIDFTWTGDISGKSASETKRNCSSEITLLCERVKKIADELGFTFSGDKRNPSDVHISSGGLMVYFNLGYHSTILDIPAKVKIEISFIDIRLYPTKTNVLRSYVGMLDDEELKYLHEKLWEEYARPVSMTCYDSREIYVEKCRAALTRIKYKLRDVLDIYYIEKKFGYTLDEFRSQIIEKTRFSIDLYRRYGESIEMPSIPPLDALRSEEMRLLLVQPPTDLRPKLKNIQSELESIRIDIIKGMA